MLVIQFYQKLFAFVLRGGVLRPYMCVYRVYVFCPLFGLPLLLSCSLAPVVFCVSFNSMRGIVHFVFMFYHQTRSR